MIRVGSDNGWIGVNMRVESHLLPPGYASSAVNLRFNRGVPETRGGALFPSWANKTTEDGTAPWGTVHGIGEFSDPRSRIVYQIVAADGKIYRCHPNNWPSEMPLPAGVTISGSVTFTQAGNKLICHRGFTTEPLWCDGVEFGWTTIPDPDPMAGVLRFPNVERSLYFQGRIWAWKDDDTLAYSDFNDFSAFQPVTQEFYVNPGSTSRGVALAKLGQSSLVLFKSREIHVLYNVIGDLGTAYGDTITLEFGCIAAESVVDVGNEVWFLSNDGIRALVEYQGDSSVGTRSVVRFKVAKNTDGQEFPVEVSDPIRPLIDRFAPNALGRVSAAYANRRFYMAVPLDGTSVLGEEELTGLYQDFDLPLILGGTYRYSKGNETLIEYSPTVNHTSSHEFVAKDNLAYAAGDYPTRSTGSLRRVWGPCNTAILVFDFANGAWAGYDTYTDVGFTHLISLPVNGVDRVLACDVRGYVAMLDTPAYADQRAVPGVEFTMVAAPGYGQTLVVNGGDTLTTISAELNGAGNWAVGDETPTAAKALANLYTDQFSNGGFYTQSFTVWDGGDVWAQQVITNGVASALRLWSTNGLLPTVTHNVTGLEVRYLTEQPIVTELITGAKSAEGGGLFNSARVQVDLQSWAADVTLEFMADGVAREYELANYVPDRTHWIYPAGKADYDLTNVNDDAGDPGREDYSVQFGPDTTPTLDLGADGVRLDLHQQRRLTYSTTDPVEWKHGRLKFTNRTGRVRILGCALDANPAGAREGAT